MPTINDKQYKKLKIEFEKYIPGFIKASDFKDQSDRTLVVAPDSWYGDYDVFLHVYLQSGSIVSHRYADLPTGYKTVSVNSSSVFEPEVLRPKSAVAPSITDLEFAKLMVKHHMPIQFLSFAATFESHSKHPYFGAVAGI